MKCQCLPIFGLSKKAKKAKQEIKEEVKDEVKYDLNADLSMSTLSNTKITSFKSPHFFHSQTIPKDGRNSP